ncbi:MAG: DUF1080 domain-containing protein [Verrucomicrobiae bacterium]|nr:DUF1080 domain-containing protein [Verrucomicrobiae bacterium]
MKTRLSLTKLSCVFAIAALTLLNACACKTCKKTSTPTKTNLNQQTHTHSAPQQPTASTTSKQPEKTTPQQTETTPWEPMFDGFSLYGWQIIDYPGKGEVTVKNGQIILGMGYMTGIKWTNDPPKINYEVEYEAMRVDSTDFFGSLTFLVNTNPCTFILGGWGGGTVGISSLDDMDASENETSKFMNFENGKWYKIRIRVTENKIQTWINNEKIIDVVHKGKKISLRPGDIELSAPFGFSTWSTTGALRNIKIRKISNPE